MNLKQQIRSELQNSDFPNLEFLYSAEVLEIALEFLDELLEEEKKDFEEKLRVQDTEITFETFQDFSLLDYFFSLLEHYQGIHNDETIRNIIETFEPKYIAFGNEIAYSKRYYEMLQYCYKNLSPNPSPGKGSYDEQKRILEKSLKAYEVRGIALPEAKQSRLKEISARLSELSQNFSNNILDSQKEFEYIISDESIISEMPDDDREVAKKRYEEKYGIKKAESEEEIEKCFQFFREMWTDEFQIDLHEGKREKFSNSDIFYIGNEIILGCVQVFKINEDSFNYDTELKGVANLGEINLGRIGVLKTTRGKGLGSSLIEYVQNHYAQKGERRMFIPAAVQNEEYYERFGFKRFSDPVDCGNTQKIMMQTDLQPHLSSQERIERGVAGYLFDASIGAYISIMKYCCDSEVRKYFYEARQGFGSQGKYDNRKNILEILSLRQEKAELLGYKNYAELSLEFKMAESPEQIIDLFSDIAEKARPKALAEVDEIQEYFALDDLQEWDLSYYARKLKEEKYALDEKKLKEYFEFEAVKKGMFEIIERLYGIEMRKINPPVTSDIPLIKGEQKSSSLSGRIPPSLGEEGSDIEVYEVYKNGQFLSYFMADFFYNPLKRPGAWANILRENSPPTPLQERGAKKFVLNVCNFQKGTDGTTLLTLSDVETMFHEFGHATHEILARSEYSELSGFHVEWDFVELPSQLLENWCRHEDGMKLFAKHYESGEGIPVEFLEGLKQLETFGTGSFILRQNTFAMLDMALHSAGVPQSEEELDAKVKNIQQQNAFLPSPEVYTPHTSFSHIFDGGYSAGYYSYMWAEIIEKEVWKVFLDSGDIFSSDIATKLHDTILAAGTQKKASELFRDFLGRDPEIGAFLNEKGLGS